MSTTTTSRVFGSGIRRRDHRSATVVERAEHIEHNPKGKLGGIVVHVVRRGDFDHFHAAQAFRRDRVNHLERFARQQARGGEQAIPIL